MIPITTFAGKQVAVFGLGKSGLLAAGVADCRRRRCGRLRRRAKRCWPRRRPPASRRRICTSSIGRASPRWCWRPACRSLIRRRTGRRRSLNKHNVEIIGDIELFCRERAKAGPQCPLIAITGTNGKSTTTALIAHLINSAGRDAQMGGNIGVPVLALEAFAPGRAYVLEVSSYQIDLAPSLKATVGILLNVSEDHLDRHGTMENYAALKTLVPASVEAGGTAVIGVDDRYTRAAADRIERAGKKVVRVSVLAPVHDGYLRRGQPHPARRRRQGACGGAARRHR